MNAKAAKHRVMIVEDEFIIADEIATIVEDAGYAVVGPIASVEEASDLIGRDRPDLAIIDANLRGRSSARLAEALTSLGVPFCVCTGYRLDDLRPTFGDVVVIQKPVKARALVAALEAALARRSASGG